MRSQYRLVSIFFVLLLFCLNPIDGEAYVSKAKTATKIIDKVLDGFRIIDSEIKDLAKIDYSDLRKILSKHYKDPEKINVIIMAVAREKKIVSAAEADDIYLRLAQVKHFRKVAKLLCSNNPAQVKGALYELRVANSAKKNGFEVLEFRRKFLGDPDKNFTDIDVVLKSKNGRSIIIECKSYARVNADMVHADAKTLVRYVDQNPNTVKVFMFAEEPSKLTRKILTDKYDCIVLAGDPDAQLLALSYMV